MSERELGLFAIFFLWIAFAILLTKWRGHKAMSLSMHGASAKESYFYYALILTIHGVLIHIFMLQWFIPTFSLPTLFTITVHFTLLLLYASALIPDTSGFLRKVHRTAAFTMAFFIAVITALTLFLVDLSLISFLVGVSAFIYMLFCMVSFGILKKLRKSFLYYQTAYIASFHIFILAASYLQ